jgi:molecular chaperone GrpE
MIRKVLGVLDDLDRAIAAGTAAADVSPLLSGVNMIRDHLLQILASEGVQALDLMGQRFDPAVAEAVSIEDTRDPERDNLIVAESGRGYMLGSTLLRPARVSVARHRTQDSPQLPEDRRDTETAGRKGSSDVAVPGPEARTE